MSNELSRFSEFDDNILDHMAFISKCRVDNCPVPEKHSFYAVPDETAPFYYGKRPCMPVVPTWLRKGKVMILGMYPTCRYATVTNPAGDIVQYVPVRDIDEPFENSRYFDTHNVRNIQASTILYEYYLKPLGLDQEDLWITNMVKCFLFRESHIEKYQELGWSEPPVQPTREDDYFKAATPCFKRNLEIEVKLCQPKFIIALGEFVCRMVHADDNYAPSDRQIWLDVRNQRLPATDLADPNDNRNRIFKDKNIFCFYHPSYLERSPTALENHLNIYVPRARAFLDELLWG